MAIVQRGAAAPTSLATETVDEAALSKVVEGVSAKSDAWASTSVTARRKLLEQVILATIAESDSWLRAACLAKGLTLDTTESGEELFSGVGTFVTMAQALVTSLHDLETKGRPIFPGPVTTAADGRAMVGVFPRTTLERLLFSGTTAEVWMKRGLDRRAIQHAQAPAYRDPAAHRGTALVLGAGNVASLGPRDVLSKLFVEGKVVVLKANPVNDYLIPHWSKAMAPLIDAGFLAIVDGGAQVGAFLCDHPLINEIHVTGSDKTYDAIVFGVGQDGAARKAEDRPLRMKPVSAELGSVSPVIVVPGNWSKKELRYQAEHVATMLTNNAGFNCLTPRVVITHAGWSQRGAFMDEVESVLAGIPTRKAYYPGAADRFGAFVAAHPEADRIGSAADGTLPWTVIRDVDAVATGDICLNVEAFCSLTSECPLPAPTVKAFISEAVRFANEVVWGSLSATVLCHPSQLEDPIIGPAVEQGIADLHYGGIGLNLFHGLVFALSTPTWGAYPGHARNDIQSGCGVVGNAYMLEGVEKSVIRGPWIQKPKPVWFATHPNSSKVMKRLLAYQAAPSIKTMVKVLGAALKP
ncbi:MAG: aldehyde dehydrogenase family protein [Actinomycetota bacterium]